MLPTLQEQHGGAGSRHREVDCRGGHLPVSAQLQRSAADLRCLHECRHLSAEENLGQGTENGE